MNKDLYIELLEEHVDDITSAMKIETILEKRKNQKMAKLEDDFFNLGDICRDDLNDMQADWAHEYINNESWLLELAKDLNDFAADWALDHSEYRKTLIYLVEKNTRECDENVRLQSKIAELKEQAIERSEVARKRYDRVAARYYSLRDKHQLSCAEELKLARENENLREDLETARKRIKEMEDKR